MILETLSKAFSVWSSLFTGSWSSGLCRASDGEPEVFGCPDFFTINFRIFPEFSGSLTKTFLLHFCQYARMFGPDPMTCVCPNCHNNITTSKCSFNNRWSSYALSPTNSSGFFYDWYSHQLHQNDKLRKQFLLQPQPRRSAWWLGSLLLSFVPLVRFWSPAFFLCL